jgi:hypothetical protein
MPGPKVPDNVRVWWFFPHPVIARSFFDTKVFGLSIRQLGQIIFAAGPACFAGQNKAFIENSASAAAQCQRQSFDGIVYPASAEQPLWGPSMIKLNQEYIELRKNGYSPGYDGNKDGHFTLDEFQEGVQPKIGINTQGFTDRIAIGAASYIMLDAESKAAIYNPEVEVYNGDLVIGERPIASSSW